MSLRWRPVVGKRGVFADFSPTKDALGFRLKFCTITRNLRALQGVYNQQTSLRLEVFSTVLPQYPRPTYRTPCRSLGFLRKKPKLFYLNKAKARKILTFT